jgi:hypothetical protein
MRITSQAVELAIHDESQRAVDCAARRRGSE